MVYRPYEKDIVIINDKNIFKITSVNLECYTQTNDIFDDDEIPNIILYQNELHSIISSDNNWHEIIDPEFETTSDVETGTVLDKFEEGLTGHGLITIGDNIYLFGGLPEALSSFGCIATNHTHQCLESMNVCSICNEQFADFNLMETHKAHHRGNGFYYAHIGCAKYKNGYKQKQNLVKHMKEIHDVNVYEK